MAILLGRFAGPRGPGDALHSSLLGREDEEVGCAAASRGSKGRYLWLLGGLAPGMLVMESACACSYCSSKQVQKSC